MNKINSLLFAILSLLLLQACNDDSADNPAFGDTDVPRIYIDWQKDMLFSTGDTLRLYPDVSPADGATYKWTLGDKVISQDKHVEYIIEEYGEFSLKFEVERNGIFNSRTSDLVIAKPFVPKEYEKMAVGFLSIDGSLSDVNWNNITHLIVTSSVVQSSGLPDITFDGSTLNIPTLITAAHNNGVYILVEFSGILGSYVNGAPEYASYNFYNAAISPKVRKETIKTMIDYATATGFDGINVYMDNASETGAFNDPQSLRNFYEELAQTAPETTDRGKFYLSMSVVSGWTKSALDGVVTTEGYDWINVLAFSAEDLAPADHSPFWLFVDDAAYWNSVGVAKEKIIITAPAFGLRYHGNVADYTWGNLWEYTEYIGYRTICNEYPDAPNSNRIDIDNGLFYDGINEVKEKAEYVVSEGYGGMALWSIDNDSKEDGKSLMQQISTSLGN